MTILTGPERRRRWSEEDQCRILAAAFAPRATVAAAARQYDVATSLIYKWRRTLGPGKRALPKLSWFAMSLPPLRCRRHQP
ncbi:transposase [Mesorhizobium sp. B2-1-8]|nr:transposase [Mesorhizobium sp. B2-1-8]